MSKKIENADAGQEYKEIMKLLNSKYAHILNDRFFRVVADYDENVLFLACILENGSRTFHYPVEARISYKDQNMSAEEAISLIIDYVDAYFEEYFQNDENTYISIDWLTHTFEDVEFDMRGQVKNLYMEELAEKLLSGEKIDEKELSL